MDIWVLVSTSVVATPVLVGTRKWWLPLLRRKPAHQTVTTSEPVILALPPGQVIEVEATEVTTEEDGDSTDKVEATDTDEQPKRRRRTRNRKKKIN